MVTEGDRNIVISRARARTDDLNDVGTAGRAAVPQGAQDHRRRRRRSPRRRQPERRRPAPSPSGERQPPSGGASPQRERRAPPRRRPAAARAAAPRPPPTRRRAADAAPSPTPAERRRRRRRRPRGAARARSSRRSAPRRWAAASALQAPADFSADPALAEKLKPFGTLTPAGGRGRCPPQMQFNVPTITCEKLDKRPPGSIKRPEAAGRRLRGRPAKYLLDVAKVLGTDVDDAERGARPEHRPVGGQPGLHRRRARTSGPS